MKKALGLLLALALVCAVCVDALADKLPPGAAKAMTSAVLKGYKPAAVAEIVPEIFAGTPGDTAALMRKGKLSMLCVFDYDRLDQVYRVELTATRAVHQDKRVPSITYNAEVYELSYAYDTKKPAAGEPLREEYWFDWHSDGTWRFRGATLIFPTDPEKGGAFPRFTLYSGGDELYLKREWWDSLGEDGSAVITEETRGMPREAWIYELSRFDLEQVRADIDFLSTHEGEALQSPPKARAGTPMQTPPEGEEIKIGEQVIHEGDWLVALSFEELTDIGPLAGLKDLWTLDLSFNEIEDIQPLAKLSSLRKLDLTHNRIATIDGLAELRKLEKLYLSGNPATDIRPLATCASLKELTLPDGVTDLSPLAGLTTLKGLTHVQGELKDLGPLANGPKLVVLWLDKNLIVDILPLKDMKTLTWLSLKGNAIADIEPLAGLKALNHLDLGGNQIADITALKGLKKLTWLNLTGNQITDLSPLKGLTNLRALYLGGNPEDMDLTPLYKLKELRELYLPYVSPDMAEALAEKLPNCHVEIEW